MQAEVPTKHGVSGEHDREHDREEGGLLTSSETRGR